MTATVEATVSMLVDMPSDMQEKVYQYTSQLFAMGHAENNPFTPLSGQQILRFLEKSRSQAERGEVIDALDALHEIGEKHGFV